MVTFLLARGGARDARMAARLARRVRQLLGRRLGCVVADCVSGRFRLSGRRGGRSIMAA